MKAYTEKQWRQLCRQLSPTQWQLVEKASTEALSVFENANTLASLLSRAILKVKGPTKKRTFILTSFGEKMLSMKDIFANTADYCEAHEVVRQKKKQTN